MDGATDDGGHMAGTQFYGPSEQINYFPQSAEMNRSPSITNNRPGLWYAMETDLKQLRLDNPTAVIKVEITPSFTTGNGRPSRFVVDVHVNNTPIAIPYNILNP